MIQKWIKDELKKVIPNLEWTIDYKTGEKETGVVYQESPGNPSTNDFNMQNPTYSVYIETDKKVAEDVAWLVHDTMHKRHQELATISGREFQVIFIQSIPPLPVGIDANKQMTYTINLQTTIRRVK